MTEPTGWPPSALMQDDCKALSKWLAKRACSSYRNGATWLWNRRTPQPTQAQAGAVPLTDEQWQRIADLTGGRILTQATKDEIERVIGIKGDQHGL